MMQQKGLKDIIAEHVQHLLDMDEEGQRAQLASFSSYAATKGMSNGFHMKSGSSGACSDRKRPGVASSASVSTAGSSGRESSYSIDSPESSGSEGFVKCPVASTTSSAALAFAANGVPVPGFAIKGNQESASAALPPYFAGKVDDAPMSSKLENATELLRAALANWESCLQKEEVRVSTQQAEDTMPAKIPVHTLKSVSEPMTLPTSFGMPEPTPTPTVAEASSPTLTLNALQRALSDLTSGFPADVAHGQFLSQAEEQEHPQEMPSMGQEDESVQTMKLLKEHLEKQQAESVLKIMKMMQEKSVQQPSGFDAMKSCFAPTSAGGFHAAWPKMPLDACQSMALAAPLGGRPAFPSMPSGPIPGAFGMSPMGMLPGNPWPSQAAVAGGHGIAGAQLRRPFPSQAGRQRQGIASTKAGPPGLNGQAPRKNRAAPPPGVEEETLRAHLRELQKIEPDRVVLVRKINRLGFESPAVLEKHYSQFGKVERVLVAHSHVKSQNRRFFSRLRPSGLGFVVMSKREEAEAIFALGQEQTIGGEHDLDHPDCSFSVHATIRVQRFQRHSEDAEDHGLPAVDEEQEEQEDGDAPEFQLEVF
mmetsp:Transcript_115005/g.215238  ORF Transcript_115005/g.215238 Transcript_115005/m.215238 type:complete len:591 (+) Transcript_115005:85-1857(+)